MYSWDSVQIQTCECVCLVCTFPQPILNSNSRSPFCLLAMHTVDSPTCVESVSSEELALSIQNIYTTVSYSHFHLLCCYLFLSIWILWAHKERDQDVETVEHPILSGYWRRKRKCKVWHMLVSSLQMSPPSEEFWGIVFRDTETLTKMNPLSHQDEAVSYSISWQCAVRVSQRGKQTHDMWKKSLLFTTASQSKKTGNWCLTNVFKRHWLINPFHSIPFNEWKKKTSKKTEARFQDASLVQPCDE